MTKKKAVAKKASSAVAVSEERPDWMGDQERGSEGVGHEDLVIPRLDVLQDLSPQIKENKPEYIEGAKPGILFNTVTKQLYGDEVMFIPVYYRKEWVIWRDIKAGGGFRGAHETQRLAVDALSEIDDADQCEIVDTGQQFGLIVHGDGSVEEVVVSMSKSKRKVDKQLNSMIKMRGGDRFSSAYSVRAVEDQNAAGQDYWNLSVKPLGYVSQDIYEKAEALYEAVKLGTKDVSREVDAPAEGEDREF